MRRFALGVNSCEISGRCDDIIRWRLSDESLEESCRRFYVEIRDTYGVFKTKESDLWDIHSPPYNFLQLLKVKRNL